MSELVKAFEYKDLTVRVMMKNEEPWWVAKDVCEVLEISKPRNAIARLDEDERGPVIVDTLGGPQEMTAVNEAGLYNLIFTSRKPAAKEFKRWVTHEVLPQIRKTGGYQKEESLSPADLRRMLEHESCENMDRFEENQALQQKLSEVTEKYVRLLEEKVEKLARMEQPKSRKLTSEEKRKIIALKRQHPEMGATLIGKMVGRPKSTVETVLRQADIQTTIPGL